MCNCALMTAHIILHIQHTTLNSTSIMFSLMTCLPHTCLLFSILGKRMMTDRCKVPASNCVHMLMCMFVCCVHGTNCNRSQPYMAKYTRHIHIYISTTTKIQAHMHIHSSIVNYIHARCELKYPSNII